MPKETIRRLSDDAARLLVAGAHLAAGDPELQKNKAALDGLAKQLGDRAPVLGRLAEAAGRVLKGKDPGELVTLAVNVAQVRAAHADLAPAAGASAPLPPALPLGTPCSSRDLYDLRAALTESGSGREEKLRNALVRNDIADLRLAEPVLQALSDPYLGERAEKDLVPRFGKALLGPIRRDFNPKGGVADARRLRVLSALDPDKAAETLRQVLAAGSAPVRQAAFGVIARQFPGAPEFLPQTLEASRKDRGGDVRAAALRALGTYASDEALETLIAGLDREQGAELAVEALSESRHPQVVPRLLKELDAELEARSKRKPEKGKETEDRVRAKRLLEALSGFKHPEVVRRGVSMLEEFGAPAAAAASHSDDPAVLTRLADLLQGGHTILYPAAIQAILKLGPQEAFQRLSVVFSAKGRDPDDGASRLYAVLDAASGSKDLRWDAFLLDLVQANLGLSTRTKLRNLLGGGKLKSWRATAAAIDVLARRGHRPAVNVFMKALATDLQEDVEISLFAAIGELGDSSLIDALIDLGKGTKDPRVMWPLQQSILKLAEPGTVAKVRKVAASLKAGAGVRGDWSELQKNLESKFPGQ